MIETKPQTPMTENKTEIKQFLYKNTSASTATLLWTVYFPIRQSITKWRNDNKRFKACKFPSFREGCHHSIRFGYEIQVHGLPNGLPGVVDNIVYCPAVARQFVQFCGRGTDCGHNQSHRGLRSSGEPGSQRRSNRRRSFNPVYTAILRRDASAFT